MLTALEWDTRKLRYTNPPSFNVIIIASYNKWVSNIEKIPVENVSIYKKKQTKATALVYFNTCI